VARQYYFETIIKRDIKERMKLINQLRIKFFAKWLTKNKPFDGITGLTG